jgi:hypothetical protein
MPVHVLPNRSGTSTCLGLARRIVASSPYIAVLVLTVYDEASVFAVGIRLRRALAQC